MPPIYTKLNLQNYITRARHQKEVLQLSTVISDNCKKELSDTYDLQVNIARTELEFLEAKELEVSFELVGATAEL
jgi:hypothetical protein